MRIPFVATTLLGVASALLPADLPPVDCTSDCQLHLLEARLSPSFNLGFANATNPPEGISCEGAVCEYMPESRVFTFFPPDLNCVRDPVRVSSKTNSRNVELIVYNEKTNTRIMRQSTTEFISVSLSKPAFEEFDIYFKDSNSCDGGDEFVRELVMDVFVESATLRIPVSTTQLLDQSECLMRGSNYHCNQRFATRGEWTKLKEDLRAMVLLDLHASPFTPSSAQVRIQLYDSSRSYLEDEWKGEVVVEWKLQAQLMAMYIAGICVSVATLCGNIIICVANWRERVAESKVARVLESSGVTSSSSEHDGNDDDFFSASDSSDDESVYSFIGV